MDQFASAIAVEVELRFSFFRVSVIGRWGCVNVGRMCMYAWRVSSGGRECADDQQ
jgi:hypothetical protein